MTTAGYFSASLEGTRIEGSFLALVVIGLLDALPTTFALELMVIVVFPVPWLAFLEESVDLFGFMTVL